MKDLILGRWERLGLQLKLQILLQGTLIIVLVAAQQWIMLQFDRQVMTNAQENHQPRSNCSSFSGLFECHARVNRSLYNGPHGARYVLEIA